MNLFCIALLSVSTLNSLALIFKPSKYRLKNKLLGASLFCYNISVLVYFTWFDSGYIINHPHMLRTVSPLIYLGAPFFYFYIRNSVENIDGLKKYDFIHFIPALVHLIDLIPFYILPFHEKQEIVKRICADITLLNYIGYGMIPIAFHYIFRAVLQLAYLIYCIHIIKKLQPQLINSINREKLKNWLFISLLLMGLLTASNFCYILMSYIYYGPSVLSGPKLIFSVISTIALFTLNLYINFSPEYVYGYFTRNSTVAPMPSLISTSGPLKLDQTVTPHQTILIDQHVPVEIPDTEIKDADALLEKIKFVLEKEKLFLNKGITLVELAKILNIPSKNLSVLINKKLKTNFNEFINGYRVAYAKELLEQNILDLYSIEGLASMVGFNSRITFFNAFKKIEGIGPKEYSKGVATNS